MGVSNKFHFDWLINAIQPVRDQIRSHLPKAPQVLGLAEHSPSPFLEDLIAGIDYDYRTCDLFSQKPCDVNDLSAFFEGPKADVICMFRSSYFIKDKEAFFKQLEKIVAPNGYLFIDLLVGSSPLPVLDFRFGSSASAYADSSVFFETSFYDDRLVEEFPAEVAAFCSHARSWPLSLQFEYLRRFPSFFFRDIGSLKHLSPATLGTSMKKMLAPKNLISLADFRDHGFEVLVFDAKYFYPEVKKFNLYNFVAARYAGGDRN